MTELPRLTNALPNLIDKPNLELVWQNEGWCNVYKVGVHNSTLSTRNTALSIDLSVRSESQRDEPVDLILIWEYFISKAPQLIMYSNLFWNLGANFGTSSLHFSNFEKYFGSKIGYAHGIWHPKFWISLCKDGLLSSTSKKIGF